MATKKTATKKTVAKKAAVKPSVPSRAPAKAPAQKMTKTALIRYMAEQMEVPPKQMGAFFSLLIETATTQTRKQGEFTIPAWASWSRHSEQPGLDATRQRAKRSRSRPRRPSSSGSRSPPRTPWSHRRRSVTIIHKLFIMNNLCPVIGILSRSPIGARQKCQVPGPP